MFHQRIARTRRLAALFAFVVAGSSSHAIDINGVLPAATDQPQIHALLRTPADSGLGNVVQVSDGAGGFNYDIQGFLDTGTSGVLLSQETQQGLGVALDSYNGTQTVFNDVAVDGATPYWVSTPYQISIAPFSIDNDVLIGNPPPDISSYTTTTPAIRMSVNQNPAATDPLGDPMPLDIFGMPVLQGKVMVLDIRPANSTTDLGETKTYVYAPNTPFHADTLDTNPGIPQTQLHVKLSSADFARFTTVGPVGAPGPLQVANPMIGPDPVARLNPNAPPDHTPPVSISFGTHNAQGSFLFDTGAQASFISESIASTLHVRYATTTDAQGQVVRATDGSGNPYLINSDTNAVIPSQFVTSVLGAGGSSVEAAGFYLTSLSLSTVEGEPIAYKEAPVLVTNVTVQDPNDPNITLTLDGDLGMNFIEPSMSLDGGAASASPFDWVTFDQQNGLLGFAINSDLPEPTAAAALAIVMLTLSARPRRRCCQGSSKRRYLPPQR